MIENEKAFVFGETKGLIKLFQLSNLNSILRQNQDLCSFCREKMPDNSIRFKGIAACRVCLLRFRAFQSELKKYHLRGKI